MLNMEALFPFIDLLPALFSCCDYSLPNSVSQQALLLESTFIGTPTAGTEGIKQPLCQLMLAFPSPLCCPTHTVLCPEMESAGKSGEGVSEELG